MVLTVQAARPLRTGTTALPIKQTADTAHSKYLPPPCPPGQGTQVRQLYVEMSCGQLGIAFAACTGVLQPLV